MQTLALTQRKRTNSRSCIGHQLHDALDNTRTIIPVLAGPTAVGKSALALYMAERSSAEIISADSRQVFRRMDIGTAKPTPSEQNRITHHFIDERDPEEPFSAGIFAREAQNRIADIFRRHVPCIVAGGSTLYIDALINGIADIPAVDPSIRRRLNRRLVTDGAAQLYDELAAVDPVFAATLDATKTQRIIRGLEVHTGTKRPLSTWISETQPPENVFKLFVLFTDRERLYSIINERVEAMLSAGLVQEVRSLLKSGVSPECAALRTIGYQEVIAFFDGAIDKHEMERLIKRNSRRYAKRQLTWFRRYDTAIWIDMTNLALEAASATIYSATK